MVHIVIGGSCAGKTSFVVNTFIHGQDVEVKRDIITISECPSCFLIGPYQSESRTMGSDRVSRKDINKIFTQVMALLSSGKDIVVEGDKITSDSFFRSLVLAGVSCKLYLIRVSPEVSISRNRKNKSTATSSHLKAVCTKAENIFQNYSGIMSGIVIDSDNVTDFSSFSLQNCRAKTDLHEMERKPFRDDFAIFILSHGRADHVITAATLQRANYTGKWYVVIDDEDDTEAEYYRNFPDRVLKFSKVDIEARYDPGDTSENRKTIFYARNACFDLARQVGVRYFLELDDDYTAFMFRFPENGKLGYKSVTDLNALCEEMIRFLSTSNAYTVALAQGGDFIGGRDNKRFQQGILRKVMNTFFCDVEKPFSFVGRINEDVNTYTTMGQRGELVMTVTLAMINQLQTQSNRGGDDRNLY